MKETQLFMSCTVFAGFVIFGSDIPARSANAQQASEPIEEIVEVAAPIERKAPGMRTETIELRRQVSFADLDLTRHADMLELEKRIEMTAKESCEKLEQMYPLPRNPSRSANIRHCTEQAIDNAAAGFDAAIAAAE